METNLGNSLVRAFLSQMKLFSFFFLPHDTVARVLFAAVSFAWYNEKVLHINICRINLISLLG